jgi:hypothetical protein
MSHDVIAAFVAAVPATIAAFAAWRTHSQVKTNHGMRAGEYLELTLSQLNAHTEQDDRNFRELRHEIVRLHEAKDAQ